MLPPPLPSRLPLPAPSDRAVERAATLARISAAVLILLAGLSTAINLPHPGTVHFTISIVALANGLVEWHWARRLREHDPRAPRALALNQIVLGVAILGYGLWQAQTLATGEILEYLQRPHLRTLLAALPPEEIRLLYERLPPLVRLLYWVVGVGGALGCWATALYYGSRRRHLAPLIPPVAS